VRCLVVPFLFIYYLKQPCEVFDHQIVLLFTIQYLFTVCIAELFSFYRKRCWSKFLHKPHFNLWKFLFHSFDHLPILPRTNHQFWIEAYRNHVWHHQSTDLHSSLRFYIAIRHYLVFYHLATSQNKFYQIHRSFYQLIRANNYAISLRKHHHYEKLWCLCQQI